MGSCQNSGPFLGTLNNRRRIIIGTQKGTIILTTTHMRYLYIYFCLCAFLGLRNRSKSLLSLQRCECSRIKLRGFSGLGFRGLGFRF